MDRRGENINQRQERLEGLRQRPRTAHGAGTAADLPAVAPGRGDSENRGRAHLGRRLRRRLGGRHHPHHAQKTPRERRQRLGGVQHDAGRDRTQVQSVGQHQPAFGPRGLLRLGMGIFRKGRDDHRRADALRGRGQGAERTFVDERPQPQPRGQRRRGGRDRQQEQRRRGVRVLAQPKRGAERHLHGFPERRHGDTHGQPFRQTRHPQQLLGDVQLHPQDRHARLDAQTPCRLHAPRNRLRKRQLQPHDGSGSDGGFDLPRQHRERLQHRHGDAGPRKEVFAPLDAQGRSQIHLQRHAQRRALRIPQGRRMDAQRQPELHDRLHGEHRGGLRRRLGAARPLGPRGWSARRIHPHDGKKRRTGLFLALSKRQRLLRPFEGERMVADRPIRPDHRTAALLVPQPPADADFGLHLPDGKPVARPGVQAGREPHAGGRPQIHPHGRRAARQRRDSADDTGRPGESRPAATGMGQLRPHQKLLRLGQSAFPAREMVATERQLHLHAPR